MTDVLEIEIACWRCKSQFRMPENARRGTCPKCGATSVITGDMGIMRYFIPPAVKRSEAIIDIKRWFHSPNMPSDLARNSVLEKLEIQFIPVWKITGEVSGWIYGRVPEFKESVRYEGKRKIIAKHKTGDRPYEKMLLQTQSWEGMGIDFTTLGTETLRTRLKSILTMKGQFTSRDEISKIGSIFETTPTPEELLSKVEGKLVAKTVIYNCQGQFEVKYIDLKVVRQRVTVIYYPVWHLKYSYQGRLFQLALDATNHQVLYGRAPLDNSAGISSLVIINLLLTLGMFYVLRESGALTIIILSFITTMIATAGFNLYDMCFLGEIKFDEGRFSDTGRGGPLQKMWDSIRSTLYRPR